MAYYYIKLKISRGEKVVAQKKKDDPTLSLEFYFSFLLGYQFID